MARKGKSTEEIIAAKRAEWAAGPDMARRVDRLTEAIGPLRLGAAWTGKRQLPLRIGS